MAEETFEKPRLAINRVYTRQGDQGETSLAGGQRVPKDGRRIEAYGTVDELNAFHRPGARRRRPAERGRGPRWPPFCCACSTSCSTWAPFWPPCRKTSTRNRRGSRTPKWTQLEREMDRMNAGLAPLRSFVLPGGSRLNAELHICRTVCRRAERACVALARVGDHSAGSGSISEPPERRALRLEPLGQPCYRRAGNFVGTEPVRIGL